MNKELLKWHMAKKEDKYSDLAACLGVHKGTVSVKIKTDGFTQNEIREIAKRYELTNDEVAEIFLS